MIEDNIHYFPGHMQKALGKIKEKLSLCDGVIELFDSRAIDASYPKNLDALVNDKVKIAVLTKYDIADRNILQKKKREKRKWTADAFSLNDWRSRRTERNLCCDHQTSDPCNSEKSGSSLCECR